MSIFDYRKTRKERTGWRDETISKRHREWGFNCPAIDIDFLMIEYNQGIPMAIIDYKRYTGTIENIHPKSIQAITFLANKSNISFFIVYYWDDVWAFQVFPINEIAKEKIKLLKSSLLSEQEFVAFLYQIREIQLTNQEKELIKKLHIVKPKLQGSIQ